MAGGIIEEHRSLREYQLHGEDAVMENVHLYLEKLFIKSFFIIALVAFLGETAHALTN